MRNHQLTQQDFQSLAQFLEETPKLVQQFTDGLSESDLRWKPSAREFSVLENMCHLNDIEREGYAVRIRKLLNEDEPFLPDIDGPKLAQERSYNNQVPEEALQGFIQAREGNIDKLKGLLPDQLDRRGTFENVGAITLGDLLTMMREHDESHREELSRLRETLLNRR